MDFSSTSGSSTEMKEAPRRKRKYKKRKRTKPSLDDPNLDDDTRQALQKEMERKKARRRMKNREAAHVSRMRKKQYISGIEEENKTLKADNAALKAENARLKAQLARLMGQQPAKIENPSSPLTDSSLSHPSPTEYVSDLQLPEYKVDEDNDTDMMSVSASATSAGAASFNPPLLTNTATELDFGFKKPQVQTPLIDAELEMFGSSTSLGKVPGSSAEANMHPRNNTPTLSPQSQILSIMMFALLASSITNPVPTSLLAQQLEIFTTQPVPWTSTMTSCSHPASSSLHWTSTPPSISVL